MVRSGADFAVSNDMTAVGAMATQANPMASVTFNSIENTLPTPAVLSTRIESPVSSTSCLLRTKPSRCLLQRRPPVQAG